MDQSRFWLRAVGAVREPSTSTPSRGPLSDLAEKKLANEMIDAYVDWREECATVWLAYEGWTCAATTDAVFAFAAYRAALDREERAADVYGCLAMQLVGGTSLAVDSSGAGAG